MNIAAAEELKMKTQLLSALERQEFILHYQPQVEINTRQIIGMEALVRWKHPDLGLVYPKGFIPLAEETGLIVKLDEWVMRTACNQAKAWQEAGFQPLRVTLNVSGRGFRLPRQIDVINNLLKETGLSSEYIELDFTENYLINNADGISNVLNELRKIGLYLSVDDFGTGYPSMSYLKNLPLYKLKVDRSFIQDIGTNADNRAIVTAIIKTAHSLRLKVIAKGVETKEQWEILRLLECDEIQGFLFSRPLPAKDLMHLLLKVDSGKQDVFPEATGSDTKLQSR